MVPKKLQIKGIKLVLLEKSGKKPFQKEWQNKIIEYDNKELLVHLAGGGNYGVMGGGEKNLIIIDFDDESIQELVVSKLPKTFTVRTGTGKLHKYFFSNGDESFKIFNKEMDTLVDVQGEGKQVVGAGSIHPNGNAYVIEEDNEIAFLDYSEIRALLLPLDKKPKKEKIVIPKINLDIENDFSDKLKNNITIEDVLKSFGVNIKFNPGECPFHSSKGGKCLGFKRDTAHCFHCDGSWNIFSLVKDYKKYDYGQALEYLAKMVNLEDELKESKKNYRKRIAEKFVGKIINFTDKRNLVQQFLQQCPIFYDKNKNWWIWESEKIKWIMVDETDIINSFNNKTTINTLNSTERTEIIEALKQEGRKKEPKPLPKTWIQFKDKIYKIEDRAFILASPEYFVTNPIPWEMGLKDETPEIDKIFNEWVGEENSKILYEILSYCLLPDYPLHRLFCFIGSGLNGKSKYLELITRFIGIENVTSSELDLLIDSRFEKTKLYKKLVCRMGETNFSEMKKTSLIKQLTGNDMIGFEFKNKPQFDSYNYAKILIATNNLPTTTDKTIGFYRRWVIIDFPNQFNEKKDILNDIPEQEYCNLAFKSLNILKELLDKREFHNEGTVEERTKKFEDKSNPLEKFLNENIDFNDPEEYIPKYEFKQRIDDWCIEHRFRKLTDTFIGIKMKELGVESSRKLADWYTEEGSKPQIRVWLGIKFKNKDKVVIVDTINPLIFIHGKTSGVMVDTLTRMSTVTEEVKEG